MRSYLITYCLMVLYLVVNFDNAYCQQDYLSYHESTCKAEKLIVQKRYSEALSTLEMLFAKYDFIFLRDYQVASQLAVLANEKEKGLKYLDLAIAKGWKVKHAKKNKILSPLIKSLASKRVIKENNNIHQPLKLKIHHLYKKDQNMALKALLRIGDRAQDRYNVNKFAPHSEEQMLVLDKILTEYGYPGEKLIANNYWASAILSHHNSISQQYVKEDTLFNNLLPKLKLALKRGEISPFELALIIDWKTAVENEHRRTAYGYIGAISSPEEFDRININRASIGLRNIDLRNALLKTGAKTGLNFYLPGSPWQKGEITFGK